MKSNNVHPNTKCILSSTFLSHKVHILGSLGILRFHSFAIDYLHIMNLLYIWTVEANFKWAWMPWCVWMLLEYNQSMLVVWRILFIKEHNATKHLIVMHTNSNQKWLSCLTGSINWNDPSPPWMGQRCCTNPIDIEMRKLDVKSNILV